jgi:hypothetical protein
MNVRGPWIEHLMEDEGLSYPDASKMLEGYESIPFIENGEHMATLIKQNAEVHFAIYRQYRNKGNISARRLRAFLLPILEAEGFLMTKISGEEDDRFVRKLGFQQIGKSSCGKRIYMLNEIKVLK